MIEELPPEGDFVFQDGYSLIKVSLTTEKFRTCDG